MVSDPAATFLLWLKPIQIVHQGYALIAVMSGSIANALWKTRFAPSASRSKPSATARATSEKDSIFGRAEEICE